MIYTCDTTDAIFLLPYIDLAILEEFCKGFYLETVKEVKILFADDKIPICFRITLECTAYSTDGDPIDTEYCYIHYPIYYKQLLGFRVDPEKLDVALLHAYVCRLDELAMHLTFKAPNKAELYNPPTADVWKTRFKSASSYIASSLNRYMWVREHGKWLITSS